MRSLRSFLNRAGAGLCLAACCLASGCAGGATAVKPVSKDRNLRVAVFPVDNITGTAAPMTEIHRELTAEVKELGLDTVGDDELAKFLTRHRIRYTGGIEANLSKALRDELHADAVLITSLELHNEDMPPKISLFCRLVTTGEQPMISWMDTASIAGDESPGVLNLGVISDAKELRKKAFRRLSRSLAQYLGNGTIHRTEGRELAPKVTYSAVGLAGEKPTIAVIPFFNQSMRKHAGEIEVLHFVKQLVDTGKFRVIEPGMVRDGMLRMRVILNDGISLPNLDLISIGLGAEYVVTGKVFEYQDFDGPAGRPRVDFSVQLVERKGKKIVWSSKSYNAGDDGVFFYDWGRIATANALAGKMTRAVVEKMVGTQ